MINVISIRRDKLVIGHLSTAYHTNFILMQNKDFERDLKKEIVWKLFGTGPEMVLAFKNEELDIGYMGLPPAIVGIDKGAPIKCVSGGHIEGTIMVGKKKYQTILQLNNKIYDVLNQFKGKSIGVTSKGSIHEVILSHYLKKYDLLNDIDVKHYGQAEFIALDMKNSIIEAGVGTPALAVFSSTLLESHLIIRAEDLWENNPSYGIFFHTKIIKSEPELIIKFLDHHRRASFTLRDSQSLAAEKIAKTFGIIDKNYAESVLKISPKYCIALSEGFIKATMEFVETLYKLGYIKRELKTDDIFNFNFVRDVHPESPHY
jgi:NitT/TauT family transport system substrate-binding protein